MADGRVQQVHESKRQEYLSDHSEEMMWFLADMEGNSLLPQTGLGIFFFVSRQLLDGNFDETKMYRFLDYTPTDEQKQKAERIMTNFHLKYGITSERNREIIEQGLLDQVFTNVKELSLQCLYLTLCRIMDVKMDTTELTLEESMSKLVDLSKQEGYTEAVAIFREMSTIAVHVIRSESKGLCAQYRAEIELFNREDTRTEDEMKMQGERRMVSPVSDRVRAQGSSLLKIEEKIVQAWDETPSLHSFGHTKLASILTGIQEEVTA